MAYANNCSPIRGRTRFQKMIFLLQAKQSSTNSKPDLGFNFVPYDYGPYSKALQLDINDLIERGLIKEEPEMGQFGKYKYKYKITQTGQTLVERLLTKRKYSKHQFEMLHKLLIEIKNDINDKDIDLLLREIYTDYPAYAQFSKYQF